MRLIHFSDTHLGYSDLNKVDPATGVNRREQDAYDAFTRVVERAIETRPDLVIHAGDLFHTPRPNNRALVCALAGLKRLVDEGIPTVVVAGNHSTPRLASSGSVFAALEIIGVRVAYEPRLAARIPARRRLSADVSCRRPPTPTCVPPRRARVRALP